MKIHTIRTLPEYHRIRPAWNEIYKGDTCASVTRSWQWMLGWLETTDLDWQILAVEDQQSGNYVAFAPMASRTDESGRTFLYPGGYPLSAHTGFLCRPEYANETAALLSAYIHDELSWNRIFMADVLDDRLSLFAAHYQKKSDFHVVERKQTECPYLKLPGTREDYVNEFLGKETRKTLRKRRARLSRLPGITITEPDSDTLSAHIDAMLTLRRQRWGDHSRDTLIVQTEAVLRSCYQYDSLYMRVMWHDDMPVAGIAVFMDPVKKTAHCFMSIYHDSVSRFSAGNILILDSLCHAIDMGIDLYDFGRGGDDYKYSTFGAQTRMNENLVIHRLSGISRIRKILKYSLLPDSLKQMQLARVMSYTLAVFAGK